ncbi:hypothetical protein [Streptomyces capitiformicae]|uniref:Uncharacterized protein n=1 Tax=Streptomyces capitiformicae TaxID=2014920 RepID=A0A919GG70_9ACTN|nr:hypothetical protein [Streptomyces capitiformicae]GHH83463.1 hypothetical protein GCM10017771_10110 [Streptomyces capitiformicae]
MKPSAVDADGSPLDQEPPEHRRYARHLRALADIPEREEADLVAAVLCDEDPQMAQSAVVHHLDRRAEQLLTDARFPSWAEAMTPVIDGRDFLTRRLREWTLLRAIALHEPWTADELITASDWLQRTAADARIGTSPAALSLLAERGRTRRVRNAAGRRTRQPDEPLS